MHIVSAKFRFNRKENNIKIEILHGKYRLKFIHTVLLFRNSENSWIDEHCLFKSILRTSFKRVSKKHSKSIIQSLRRNNLIQCFRFIYSCRFTLFSAYKFRNILRSLHYSKCRFTWSSYLCRTIRMVTQKFNILHVPFQVGYWNSYVISRGKKKEEERWEKRIWLPWQVFQSSSSIKPSGQRQNTRPIVERQVCEHPALFTLHGPASWHVWLSADKTESCKPSQEHS